MTLEELLELIERDRQDGPLVGEAYLAMRGLLARLTLSGMGSVSWSLTSGADRLTITIAREAKTRLKP